MSDLVTSFFQLISEEDGHDYKSDFVKRAENERIGQAFFNTLPPDYQKKIRGTSHDPFYKSNWMEIYDAIDFLMTK